MGKPSHWIVILQPVSSAFAYRYDPWYRADTQRPVDVITDVVNDLGVKILQQYSGHGNVAFSPTGVAFVLAALHEGSAGRGSQQIAEAVGLPANRDVTRIGFRDIHRRLRSYLNADGFLGGLTLSRENTRLRPEYEDILRFYGFDLSSIEQEANVTVSAEDTTSATTEFPASTVGSTTELPTERTGAGNASDTRMTTGAITTPATAAAAATTTIAPSIAPDAARQTVALSAEGTGVQSTLTPGSGTAGAAAENITARPADSSATVTSGESAQPSPSAGAEIVPVSSNTTVTTAINNAGPAPPPTTTADSQTSPSAVTMSAVSDDRNVQTGATVAGAATNGGSQSNVGDTNGAAIPNTGVQVPMGTGVTVASTTVATDNGATMSAGVVTAAPTTLGANTEAPMATSMTNAGTSATNAVGTSTEVLMAASTVIVNMVPANTSAINATLNTATSLIPASPGDVNTSSVPSTVTVAMTDNIITTQPSTSVSSDITGTNATTIDLATAFATTVIPPVQAANGTTNGLAGNANNSTVVNPTASPMLTDNQTVASLVDQNTVATSRKRKSLVIEANETGSNALSGVTGNDKTVKDESTNNLPTRPHERRARSPRGYFSSYPDEGIWMQDLDIWKSYGTASPSESPVGDSTSEISFLVNGCDVSSVSATRYIAVLPFAYFPSLHAVALEFPLDDPRYNIILLMPTDRTDTNRLARDLSGKSLRSLRKRLQPTWVRATIPSFMLRGFVTLTSFLQRLGISDVFEPRVADLSPMTADLGVYARDVQQSIGVNIRNYMKPDRTHSRNGLFERAGPVPFTALHPFLYFIVDTETSVSLIAGRVDDPLNSRILQG